MFKFYDYIYYRSYCTALRSSKRPVVAAWSAYIQMELLLLFNLLGMLGISEIMSGNKALDEVLSAPVWLQFTLALLLGIVLNPIWGGVKRAQAVAAKFEKLNETKQQKLIRGIGVNLYQLGWIVLTIICLLVLRNRGIPIGQQE